MFIAFNVQPRLPLFLLILVDLTDCSNLSPSVNHDLDDKNIKVQEVRIEATLATGREPILLVANANLGP